MKKPKAIQKYRVVVELEARDEPHKPKRVKVEIAGSFHDDDESADLLIAADMGYVLHSLRASGHLCGGNASVVRLSEDFLESLREEK